MKTNDLIQGSPAWLAYRREHFNASDAPAMMGCSPYKTRNELLFELYTGLTAEVSLETQQLFDDGHRFEALSRPGAEEIVGEDLYPVTGSEGKFSASFDGLTMDESIAFEHKSLNKELRDCIVDEACGNLLPLNYRVQMEQQLFVSGAEKCLFMATKWNGNTLAESRHTWYYADEALRAQIIAGWAQFESDLADYVPEAVAEVVMAAPTESLPAVSVQMRGEIAIISNLDVFGAKLRAFVEAIDKEPSTDQAFANAEAAIKTLEKAQAALEQAESAALAQTSSIEEMRRTVGDYANLARTTRLVLEKVVKSRKEQIKTEIVAKAKWDLAAHVNTLNDRLDKAYMPPINADFGLSIKGLRTIASLHNAVDTLLANTKIEANAIADKIQVNLATLRELGANHAFLFTDAGTIVQKAPDDLTMLVKGRISEYQLAEEKRLEAERERIRTEEVARADREARARAAEEERQRAVATAAEASRAAAPPAPPAPAPPTSSPVRAVTPASAPSTDLPTLKLGEINARLAPLSVSADGLAQLGFEATTERAAKLYRQSDWPRICAALIEHIGHVENGYLQAA